MKIKIGLFVSTLLWGSLVAAPALGQDKQLKLSVTDFQDFGGECRPIITLMNQSPYRVDEIRMKLSALGPGGTLLGEERAIIFATKAGRSGQAYSLTSSFADSRPIFSHIGGCQNLKLLSIDALQCEIEGQKRRNEACDHLINYVEGVIKIEGLSSGG